MLSTAEVSHLLKGNRPFWIMRVFNFTAAFSAILLVSSPFPEVRLVSAILLTSAGTMSATIFLTNSIVSPVLFSFKYRNKQEIDEDDFSWLVALSGVKLKNRKLQMIKGLDNAFSNRSNKSISYGDTLYNRQERSDRQFVMAHELGHQKGHGISLETVVRIAMSIVVISMVASLTEKQAIIIVTAVSLFSLVLISLRWDSEFYADQFACEILGPRTAINALRRMAPRSRLFILSDSHPSIARRIRRIEKKWGLPPTPL